MTKDNTLQSYFTQKQFTTFNDYLEDNTPEYNSNDSVIRYYQDFATLQPRQAKVGFSPTVDAVVVLTEYAVLLTEHVISIRSDVK